MVLSMDWHSYTDREIFNIFCVSFYTLEYWYCISLYSGAKGNFET